MKFQVKGKPTESAARTEIGGRSLPAFSENAFCNPGSEFCNSSIPLCIPHSRIPISRRVKFAMNVVSHITPLGIPELTSSAPSRAQMGNSCLAPPSPVRNVSGLPESPRHEPLKSPLRSRSCVKTHPPAGRLPVAQKPAYALLRMLLPCELAARTLCKPL